MPASRWIFAHTEVAVTGGLVVTKDRLATEAGIDMLKRGGNAVDAAVAAAFAAGVVEPWMSGVGGGGFMLIHLAREGRTIAVDYAMRSPLAAHSDLFPLEEGRSADMFGWRKVRDDANIHGWKSVAVPGAVAGLCEALRRFGRLSLQEVLAPAIRLAREGFPVTWHKQLRISADAAVLSRYPDTAAIFFQDGMPKVCTEAASHVIRQPELARTLEAIAVEGPEVFYRGEIAARIVEASRAGGGILAREDFETYRAEVIEPPASVAFGDCQVFSSPCPSGGPTLQEALGILAECPLAEAGHNSADALHWIAEASRLAWADRFTHLADPSRMAFPWRRLLDPDFLAQRRALIDPSRAMSYGRTMRANPPGPGTTGDSTTALVAADPEGNVVSLTQTLMHPFGSRVTVPGTGVLLNNGMYWFDPEPGKPNSVAPGVKPLNNMSPLLVLCRGRPFLAISSSGGRRIIDANLNIFLNAAVFGLGMQDAVSAPRIDLSTGLLVADDRLPAETIAALRARGHRVVTVTESPLPRHFASPTCLRIDPETGVRTSGADPFHPAVAMGFDS